MDLSTLIENDLDKIIDEYTDYFTNNIDLSNEAFDKKFNSPGIITNSHSHSHSYENLNNLDTKSKSDSESVYSDFIKDTEEYFSLYSDDEIDENENKINSIPLTSTNIDNDLDNDLDEYIEELYEDYYHKSNQSTQSTQLTSNEKLIKLESIDENTEFLSENAKLINQVERLNNQNEQNENENENEQNDFIIPEFSLENFLDSNIWDLMNIFALSYNKENSTKYLFHSSEEQLNPMMQSFIDCVNEFNEFKKKYSIESDLIANSKFYKGVILIHEEKTLLKLSNKKNRMKMEMKITEEIETEESIDITSYYKLFYKGKFIAGAEVALILYSYIYSFYDLIDDWVIKK